MISIYALCPEFSSGTWSQACLNSNTDVFESYWRLRGEWRLVFLPGRPWTAVTRVISRSGSGGGGGGYDPTDAASSTPGNSLFTKALPPCAFGTVTPRFDFSLFKEVCYCHQGLYLITERHQREMKHSGESLEGASWRKVASSLGWEWLLKFLFLCRPAFFFFFFLPSSLFYLFIYLFSERLLCDFFCTLSLLWENKAEK